MFNTRLLLFLLFFSYTAKSESTTANSISKMSTLDVEHSGTRSFTKKNLSFFEKTILKTAERKLRKAYRRAAEIQGDSTRPCGKIVLLSGDTIAVELSELNRTQVKYRRCGYPDDPVFTLERADVRSVLASNGDALHNNQKVVRVSKNTKANNKPLKKDSSLATVSFIFSTLALLIALAIGVASLPLALVGLICGGLAYFRVTSDPERYGGKGLSMLSILFGSLGMLLLLL